MSNTNQFKKGMQETINAMHSAAFPTKDQPEEPTNPIEEIVERHIQNLSRDVLAYKGKTHGDMCVNEALQLEQIQKDLVDLMENWQSE